MKLIILLISINFYLINCQDGSGSGSGDFYDTTEEPSTETRPPEFEDYTIDDGGTTRLTTIDPKIARCKYLNEIRANFTICCKYPGLVIWKWQAEECEYECRNVRRIHLRCCMLPCLFRKLGVLKFSEDPSVKPDVDPQGLRYSFLLSVGNDTVWDPVVSRSTQRCADDLMGTNDGYDCDVIPSALFTTIDCCYKENYLRCPVYNPHRLSECAATRQFIEECYGN